jgi:anti-anti-sigma regulatory factor
VFEIEMAPATDGRPRAVVVRLGDSCAHTDVAGLCAQLQIRLASTDADLVVCDLGALPDDAADACTLDAIARLQLTARRVGRHLRLRGAPPRLEELLRLTGLCGVVPCCDD